MADIIDQANDLNDQMLEIALRNAQQTPQIPAKGYCHNCLEEVPPQHLFCDVDCRDDYQKRTRR